MPRTCVAKFLSAFPILPAQFYTSDNILDNLFSSWTLQVSVLCSVSSVELYSTAKLLIWLFTYKMTIIYLDYLVTVQQKGTRGASLPFVTVIGN